FIGLTTLASCIRNFNFGTLSLYRGRFSQVAGYCREGDDAARPASALGDQGREGVLDRRLRVRRLPSWQVASSGNRLLAGEAVLGTRHHDRRGAEVDLNDADRCCERPA